MRGPEKTYTTGRRLPIDRGMRTRSWTAPAAAVLAVLIVLALTALVDSFARRADIADARATASAHVDAVARDLSDVIARETAAVETLAAFVEISAGDPAHLEADFPLFAAALMRQGGSVRSVQLAPDSVLDFVYPLAGNEPAVGLDLLADPDRRRLLAPAIESGTTVIQGPVELVQGGLGVLVRKPVYLPDGSYWGMAAVLLDWPSIADRSGFEMEGLDTVTGLRMAGDARVLAGVPEAFEGDPLLRTLVVGATDTEWELAMRPIDGWPSTAALTPVLWLAGSLVAVAAAVLAFMIARRPEILRRERERALSDLAVADARYQATFEHAGVGIAIIDASGTVLSANPSFRTIVGVGPEERVEGRRVHEFIDPADHREYARALIALQRGARHIETESRIAGSDGRRWSRTRVTPIIGRAEEPPHYVAIVEDTTIRRTAEQALAQSEMRFRQLFELAPIAIQREDHSEAQQWLEQIAEDGVDDLRAHLDQNPQLLEDLLATVRITDANPAAMALQRHLETGDEVLTLRDRFTVDAGATFIESLVSMWEGKSEHELSVKSRAADGSLMHLDVRWHVPNVAGVPDFSNVMVTVTDVTALRDTERKLEQLLESKDRFVASVAHELRTPLTAVVGFAQELQEAGAGHTPEEAQEFQELIAFHSIEMSMLIEDLLVWARADIGEVRVEPEVIDLAECVRQTLSLLPGTDVVVVVPNGGCRAYADPTRTRQIIRNLATNAVRYGGDDVVISVRTDAERAVLEVSDDGPPLSPADMHRIFEPYERAVDGNAQPGSIGLGLPVSRSLARLQGGDVVVVREQGRNVFRVTFPSGEPARSMAG